MQFTRYDEIAVITEAPHMMPSGQWNFLHLPLMTGTLKVCIFNRFRPMIFCPLGSVCHLML